MQYKKLIIIIVVIIIILLSVLIITFLTSEPSKETIKGTNSTIQRIKIPEEERKAGFGKLEIKANMENVNIVIIKVLSQKPFELSQESKIYKAPVFIETIQTGDYLIDVTANDYQYLPFTRIINIEENKLNKIDIILIKSPEFGFPESQTEGTSGLDEASITKLKKDLEEYYNKYPLVNYLPYKTDHFSMDLPDNFGIFPINLFIPKGIGSEDLTKMKSSYLKEAYDWIQSKGINPEKLKIEVKIKRI